MNENHSHRKLTKLIAGTTALSNSMELWAMPCKATQDRQVMVERSDKMWSTGDGNGKPLHYSCLENPMNNMKRQKDTTLKDDLPRLVGAENATWELLLLLSRYSCPTQCDPIGCSPPGSAVPGILQARTLEWVAIAFPNAWKWKVKVKSLSHVQLSATPWPAAHQAPPSMGFSRQEYWSGVSLPSSLENSAEITPLKKKLSGYMTTYKTF